MRRPRFRRRGNRAEPFASWRPASVPVEPARAPGAGSVVPVDDEPAAPQHIRLDPATVVTYTRFVTAAGALAFAEQTHGATAITRADCAHHARDDSWWVVCTGALMSAREAASLCGGELFVRAEQRLVPDRGWSEDLGSGPSIPLADLDSVPPLALVRTAGLHRTPVAPIRDAVVLLPGSQVTWLLYRALDVGLEATYQQVRLTPLFDEARSDGDGEQVSYAVTLRAGREPELPAALLAALSEDPAVLVCRLVEQALLVEYRTAAPLSDRALTALAGSQSWLLATPRHGCARLTWHDDVFDAASLIHLGADHQLSDVDYQDWIRLHGLTERPVSQPVALVRARVRDAPVDAILLTDEEIDTVPPLIAGEPLAESAFLVLGRDRHLLSAPGGLLAQLPIGEALTCIGPGALYLPIGYRIEPPLPASARGALIETDEHTAKVLLPSAILVYDLRTRRPVWRLWAGRLPELDPQLPADALAELAVLDKESAVDRPRPVDRERTDGDVVELPAAARQTGQHWLQLADDAERARDYITAARLYSQHNDPLRAARMYERHAQEQRS